MSECSQAHAKLFNSFEKVYEIVYEESQRELELANALADDKAASREESKLEALAKIKLMLTQACQEETLEATERTFLTSLDAYYQEKTQELNEARAHKNTEAIIRAQIQMSLMGIPEQSTFARGTFQAALKQAKKVKHG